MIVTPGIVLAEGELITTEKLNQLGQPAVDLDANDVQEIVDEIEETLGNGIAGRNYFTNPGLDKWTRGTGPVSCAEGARQLLADDWWVRCNSASSLGSGGTFLPTYRRVTSAHHQQWIYGARITGENGVGSCDFGQDLAQHVSAALTPAITVTFDLYNATGESVTPTVRLDTCNAAGVYSSVTNQASVQASTSVANNTLQTFTITLDTSAIGTLLRNGCQIYVRIPSPRLASSTAYVEIFALKVEIGSAATSRYTERDLTPATSSSSASATAPGWLRNADFSRWLDDSVTCAEDVATYCAEGWAVIPADGSTLVYARSTTVPGTEALYSAQLTGDFAVTGAVDFAQDIPAAVAANLRRSLTFSIYLYNGSGAAFQPTLRLDTCATRDDFAALTNRASSTSYTCAAGAWTRVELTFDGSTTTNISNGARLIVRLPESVLASDTYIVRFAQAQLEPGGAASTWSVLPVVDSPAVVTRTRNLSVSGSTTSITYSADEAVLIEPGGSGLRVFNLSGTLTTTAAGLDGLDTGAIAAGIYHLWLVSNGESHGAVISTSATEPTMPTGYRYRARVSGFRLDGTGNADFRQRGGLVFLTPAQLFNTTVTTSDTYQSITAADYVPTWATAMGVEVQLRTSGGAIRAAVAATSAGLGEQRLVAGTSTTEFGGAYATGLATVPVLSNPVELWFKAGQTSLTYLVRLHGYQLPVG